MDRRSLFAGALLGAAAVAGGLAFLSTASLPTASAEDPPILGPIDPAKPVSPGPTINPIDSQPFGRTGAGGGYAMGGANQNAIALSAPLGGEAVVYYFDTKEQRLLVYQYQSRGDKSGLKLLAARHFDYDLKLEDYGTTPTRADLKEAYDAAFAKGQGREVPAKRVEIGPSR